MSAWLNILVISKSFYLQISKNYSLHDLSSVQNCEGHFHSWISVSNNLVQDDIQDFLLNHLELLLS